MFKLVATAVAVSMILCSCGGKKEQNTKGGKKAASQETVSKRMLGKWVIHVAKTRQAAPEGLRNNDAYGKELEEMAKMVWLIEADKYTILAPPDEKRRGVLSDDVNPFKIAKDSPETATLQLTRDQDAAPLTVRFEGDLLIISGKDDANGPVLTIYFKKAE